MSNIPSRPKKNDPLWDRISGRNRTPAEWVKIAHNAEKEKRYGDAYYYWLAAVTAYTRAYSRQKGVIRISAWENNAEKCLEKWQKLSPENKK